MSLSDSRLGQNPVQLIGINAPFEPKLQFGREFSSSHNKRESVASAWGVAHNGRPQNAGNGAATGIKQPLPAREQTALSYQLSPQLQQQLRGGMLPLQNQGRSAYFQRHAALESVHLGQAISASRSHQAGTIAAAPNPRGGVYLRRVTGDYSF
ncbi:hypothetical protein [Alteromonas sp. a30]|uniref:hypothetical protein n=1 Tax=Alteromonas sp. a30 TaxID=2730917 RepID=UPI0022806055|nr:hypothetical protein [Alteromonas sp. a30]MCY7293853.1 hypothetical protein [Alteromonas sp. a30]